MTHNHLAGSRPAKMALAIAATATLVGSVAATGVQAAPPGSADKSLYIVQTFSPPLAGYNGTVAGFARTRPADGKRLNAHSNAAKRWSEKLKTEHDAALKSARVSTSAKVYEYSATFNGFAAQLTAAEVARLKKSSTVVNVWKNEIRTVDTVTTPDYLGLTGKKGVWEKQFDGDEHAGEGVIVGVIDTGFWPENPAFGPLGEPRPDQAIIDAKWHGACDTGTSGQIACNNKVIGARYFGEGISDLDPGEFQSPRDFNGHGSHTASTAAGDNGVEATIYGSSFGKISGMAPAARLAVYKGLWQQSDGTGSGTTSDLVAAIDAAVADGVDVINYSVSGSLSFVVDPVEIAFLNAAASGVFVSASAGNSGASGPSTVAHNSPWVTTVAASTHDRGTTKAVTLGDGATYTGTGTGGGTASLPLIDAESAPAAGRTGAESKLCGTGTLDAGKVAGKIVLCERGTHALVDKAAEVMNAGGAGMVLFNQVQGLGTTSLILPIPALHIENTDGLAVKAYAATAGATATIAAATIVKVTAPAMAGFSSFGPALAGSGDLLKPDITAPGVDIIAAVAPPANDGQDFASFQGTSMSAPHIAGIAALLKGKNPTWTPMMVKSAMMTTAFTTDSTGAPIQAHGADGTPLNFGAGHVAPAKAFDPGLVYDSNVNEWIQYGCGIGQIQLISTICDSFGSIDPSDLNYPSISIGDLAGVQTVIRTVTNVTKRTGVYYPKVKAPAGTKVKVSPRYLVVKPGMTATYTVQITRTTAPVDEWTFGSITLKEVAGRHKVTSPIAVRPVAIAAPGEVTGTGATGSATVGVTAGYAGTLNATVNGLVASNATNLSFPSSSGNFVPVESDSVKKVTVTVPAGSPVARFATYDADVPAGTDVDLFVFSGGQQIAASAGGTAEESVTLTEPGTYDVYVHMFAFTAAAPVNVPHHAFVVGPTAAGNITVAPASQAATVGGSAGITLDWNGLGAGRYLGVVLFDDGTATVGKTIVTINN